MKRNNRPHSRLSALGTFNLQPARRHLRRPTASELQGMLKLAELLDRHAPRPQPHSHMRSIKRAFRRHGPAGVDAYIISIQKHYLKQKNQ